MDSQTQILLDAINRNHSELKEDVKDIGKKIETLQVDSVSLKKDVDSAHEKIRYLEDDMDVVKPKVSSMERECQSSFWKGLGKNALDHSIKIFLTFATIFLVLSCGNVKPAIYQTLNLPIPANQSGNK